MTGVEFKTIPEELLFAAEAAKDHFLDSGYGVEIEGRHIGFPLTPALVCTRGHETLIVEVSSVLDERRVVRWIKYCRSQTRDTRFSLVIRATEAIPMKAVRFAASNMIGLCTYNDEELMEVRPHTDLAVHVDLPDLIDLPDAIRPLLAPAFAKFAQQDWRDGLSDAYQAAEHQARDYLKTEISGGRVKIVVTRKKQPYVLQQSDIDGMTLGALKDAFGKIQNQNHKDAVIYSTLQLLNKTRPKLAHHKKSAAAEAEIRQSAGNHMYTVITCLEEIAA